MGVIDWTRMARPQSDGYDTQQLIQLAAVAFPKFKKVLPGEGEPFCFGGLVALKPAAISYAPTLRTAPFTHRNIGRVGELLERVWPEMYNQVQFFLGWIEPIINDDHLDNDTMQGCTSGGSSAGFGGIMVTCNSLDGFAEGIVHEMGHLKLHAMGVNLMDWNNLVGNDQAARYDSPVRKDTTRPMGAVLHAQYSYIHVLQLDVALAKAGVPPGMFALNLHRMKEGRATLDQHFTPDANGEKWLQGLNAWTDELFAEAEALLGQDPR